MVKQNIVIVLLRLTMYAKLYFYQCYGLYCVNSKIYCVLQCLGALNSWSGRSKVECWMMSAKVMRGLLALSVRTLTVRAIQPNSWFQLNIITNTLGSTESAYSQDSANLKHLPEAMARHVCEKNRHADLCVYTHLRDLSHGPHDQATKTGQEISVERKRSIHETILHWKLCQIIK